MDDSKPPSTASLLESSLEQAVDRLMRVTPTSETKRLLIEARRLRGLMANWRSIPPSPDVRREMLARVMGISASAAAATAVISAPPPSPPSIATIPSPPRREDRATTQPSASIVVGLAAPAPLVAPVSSRSTEIVAAGVVLVRREGLELETLDGVPGVELRFPPTTTGARVRGVLVTLRPGTELPGRFLPGGEVLLVVDGTAKIGPHPVKAGDVSHTDPGAEMPPVRTETGCTLFLAAPAEEPPR